jgi:hypothetical protein
MERPDVFDRVYGEDAQRAETIRSLHARYGRTDGLDLYVGMADVLNGRTACAYAPVRASQMAEKHVGDYLYTTAEVRAFIDAWAAADFFYDIRWTMGKWDQTYQPIEPLTEAIPAAYELYTSGQYTTSQICVSWNEGGFWAMHAIHRGIDPELAGALG